jgi:hypothetical protein
MPQLNSILQEKVDFLSELEAVARKLQNPNFADIVKSARARMAQLLTHPDLENVAQLHGDEHAPGSHANLDAFQNELAALVRIGDDQSPRAQELRVLIGQLQTDQTKKSAPFPTAQPQQPVAPPAVDRTVPRNPTPSGASFGP